MFNSLDPDQTAPMDWVNDVCLVMLGIHLQQKTSADDIFRCIISRRFEFEKVNISSLTLLDTCIHIL